MPNHEVMYGCEFEGVARTQSLFSMLDLGAYPALIAGDNAIRGELYQVNDNALRRLDGFERVPELYRRSQTSMDNGTRAWLYLLNVDAFEPVTLKERPVVPDGDWAQWMRNP
jgi:gamma-glutamylcyclotransferase (GGCT)/AIG2-like uncharacterized protein YtfP